MRPIHPFPARMAPEIALEVFGTLPNGSRVLDPMCGSGTVIRQAVECGFDAVGLDIDQMLSNSIGVDRLSIWSQSHQFVFAAVDFKSTVVSDG